MKAPVKILLFIDQLGSGGAQRQLTELAKGFRERGAEVGFLVYHGGGFYAEGLARDGYAVKVVEAKNQFVRFIRLRRYIRRGGFDAVLSFLPRPNIVACLAGLPRRKWSLVVGERNAEPELQERFRRLSMQTYRLADFVTSNSRANVDMVLRALPSLDRRKTAVIPNIVDFGRFRPREKPHHPDGRFRLVVAARHHPQKNLSGLVEGVNLLSDPLKSRLRVDWYGDYMESPAFAEGVAKINRYGLDDVFRFHQPVREIEEVISAADAVGLFSLYEGLPNAVIEGMAAGKPVVASAVSDVPTLIADERLLCDPRDAASIASSLTCLMSMSDDELNRIGDANRVRARNLFDRESILDRYLEMLLPQ